MDNIANRLKRLAKAIAYHDLAYGEALENPENPIKIKDGTPKIGDHLRLWEIEEELISLSEDIRENADWEEMRDAIWDPGTYNTDIKSQIFEDIASEPQVRIIKLPSILAESEFDELLEQFKSNHMLTEIYGSRIWGY